jgi:hypothetical protein
MFIGRDFITAGQRQTMALIAHVIRVMRPSTEVKDRTLQDWNLATRAVWVKQILRVIPPYSRIHYFFYLLPKIQVGSKRF